MTIYATKLHRPRPRPNWIVRPRLLALLDRGLRQAHRLLLISAPAGAGKTTLLSHWLAERSLRAAWLSLDAEDDDPIQFWTCVLSALQSVAPDLGQEMAAALRSAAPPPAATLLPALLNAIGAQTQPIVLILDDYHVITNTRIHESVATVVERMPHPMLLVICTRADPPLSLARWRARGEMLEVRAPDLRFTADEGRALLNESMALDLELEEVQLLVQRTEGWAVGLQLVGLSLQGHAAPRVAIQSFAGSRHHMFEYLLEEVLARQPEATQRFLLATSILSRMCASLCEAVFAGEPIPVAGAVMLLDLQRQNLFIVPLDDEHVWFRYHHLFAELLRARLQQTAPEWELELHRRASDWYEHNELPAEAVQHALAARDWQQAAQLLEAHEQDWWTGSNVAVMNLLPHLPDEVVLRGPNLSVYKAWFLLIRGQLVAAALLLAHVEAILQAAGTLSEQRGLLSFVALQQAYIAEISGTPNPSMRAIDLATLAEIPEDRGAMRNSAEVILAYILYRSGEFAAAETLLKTIIARDTHTGATNGIPISASRLVRVWLATGRLHEAEALCRQCAELVRARGKWRFYVAGNLSIVLGEILREWNRLDEAETMIRAGIEDNAPWQIAHAYALGQTALARVLLAKGDPDRAHAAILDQWRLTDGRSIPPDLAAETRAVQLQIALAQGDLQAAAAFVAEWSPWSQTAGAFRSEQDLISLAQAFLAIGSNAQAHEVLLLLKQGAAAGGRNRRLIEIQLLLARAQLLQGQARAAADNVAQSLALAAGMGCVRVFQEQGAEVQHLIAAAAHSSAISPAVRAWAAVVVAALGAAHTVTTSGRGAADTPRSSQQAGAPLTVPLTPREGEVLRLLAHGCSNQEIATQLAITLHAVKKHTGNIYGKLGVTSRTQAIVLARKLGLLA